MKDEIRVKLLAILKEKDVDVWYAKHCLRWHNGDLEESVKDYNDSHKDSKLTINEFAYIRDWMLE